METRRPDSALPAKKAKRQRKTSGVAAPVTREHWTRTVAVVNAALRVWEAKHATQSGRSAWIRRSESTNAS
jgi:hypothetical protein